MGLSLKNPPNNNPNVLIEIAEHALDISRIKPLISKKANEVVSNLTMYVQGVMVMKPNKLTIVLY